MMKKIISLLLTMLLVLVPAAIANAEDAAPSVDITVDIMVYTIDVSVKTDSITSGLTLKVYPLVFNETTEEYTVANAALPIYLGECTEYSVKTTTEEITDEATGETVTVSIPEYTYVFDSFNVLKSATTGKYRAVINNTYTHDFNFVNKNDKIELYNDLAAASADEIEGLLSSGAEEGIIDFELGEYFAYPESVKDKINACLADLELPALGTDPTDELLQEYESTLKPEVARLITVAEFAQATDAEFDAIVRANDAADAASGGVNLGFDLTYYADEALEMDPADVRARLQGLAEFGYEAEETNDAFDLAVLLTLLDKADRGTVTSALAYYNGGCVNLDTALTANFSDAQLNLVSQTMKTDAATYNSAAAIEEGYKKAAQAVGASSSTGGNNNGSTGPSSSSSSSSSSGFGGSGSGANRTGTGSTRVDTSSLDSVPVVSFSDLGDASWAQEAITALANKSVVSGKGDGRFYPNDTVTREEFVKIIVEAFGIYNERAVAAFDDVAAERWSYGYIASGVHAGIIKGISDTEFNPAGTMSRQDMAVIMHRVADLLGMNLTGDSSVFADDAEIAAYAKEAVGGLSAAGIINGTGNDCFSPLGTVTRAQAAKVVYELMKAVGGAI